jgi:hypothetical protein
MATRRDEWLVKAAQHDPATLPGLLAELDDVSGTTDLFAPLEKLPAAVRRGAVVEGPALPSKELRRFAALVAGK